MFSKFSKMKFKHKAGGGSPFRHLRVNQAQSIRDAARQRSAGPTAGGGARLQVTRRLQPSAIVILGD